MSRDRIVDDVRAVRDEIARESNYDVAAIFASLRAVAEQRKEPRVELSPRPVRREEGVAVQQRAAADGGIGRP